MASKRNSDALQTPEDKNNLYKQIAYIVLAIVFFLFAIDLMGTSFKYLGRGAAESLVLATSNPFIGLFIGLLITAIIQSSSTSTAIVVAVVASGTISLADAVPIIMGANIGTTLTSTIVSLGFITKAREYRKAFSAGVVHDFFNIIVTAILFPLEYYYGFLSRLASTITQRFIEWEWIDSGPGNFFENTLNFQFSTFLVEWIDNFFIVIILSFVLLFLSIKVLSKIIYTLLIGDSVDRLKKYVFKRTYKSFGWGILLTAGIHSSSVTTSLMVPLVGTSKISLRQAFPFILGANVGTTITALTAALFKSEAAIAIALTHLLFNLIGVLIFLPFPILRRIPIAAANAFSKLTINYKLIGFVYVIFTFFIFPFMLIYFNKQDIKIKEINYERAFFDGSPVNSQKVIIKKLNNREAQQWMVFNDLGSENLSLEDEPNKIFDVYQKGNVLFIGEQFYLINKMGFCWDAEDQRGKFQMCIDSIYSRFPLSANLVFDSVYSYKKNYYQSEMTDSISYNYYISIPDGLLVRTDKLRLLDTVYVEKIVSIEKPKK